MDIGKSFSYSFEDKDWITKYLLGALISSIPILNFAWVGYMLDIIRNVADGFSTPLPDWSDFGDKWVKGLLFWLAGMIYALPALILFVLPFSIGLASSFISGSDFGDAAIAAFTGIGILLACLMTLYFLAYSFFYPAVSINFARKGTFGSCFQLKEIFRLVSENIGNYMIAWLVAIFFGFVVGAIASIIISFLGFIICIGWVLGWALGAFVAVWMSVVFAHLFGQVAAEGVAAPVLSIDEESIEEF